MTTERIAGAERLVINGPRLRDEFRQLFREQPVLPLPIALFAWREDHQGERDQEGVYFRLEDRQQVPNTHWTTATLVWLDDPDRQERTRKAPQP